MRGRRLPRTEALAAAGAAGDHWRAAGCTRRRRPAAMFVSAKGPTIREAREADLAWIQHRRQGNAPYPGEMTPSQWYVHANTHIYIYIYRARSCKKSQKITECALHVRHKLVEQDPKQCGAICSWILQQKIRTMNIMFVKHDAVRQDSPGRGAASRTGWIRHRPRPLRRAPPPPHRQPPPGRAPSQPPPLQSPRQETQ